MQETYFFVISYQCRVILHLIRENRERQVIGVATVDILKQKDQGFKYFELGQCADGQADIELSVGYSSLFQLSMKSEIGYFYPNIESPNYHYGNQMLEGSRVQRQNDSILNEGEHGKALADSSIVDKSQYNILKQSKAVSQIEYYRNKKALTNRRPQRPSLKIRVKRKSDVNQLRKSKPQNFSQCAPQEIITHYQTQIKTFQQQIRERDDWAAGMKQLIQQLEAENQLLKEIKIQQLAEYEVQNLEQGIQFVSKLVHSKFQASRSMIQESYTKDQGYGYIQKAIDQSLQEQSGRDSSKQQNLPLSQQQQRPLTQTKSFKDLPMLSQRQSQPQQPQQLVQSHQQLQIQNALNILTSINPSQNNKKSKTSSLHSSAHEHQLYQQRVAQLQEQLFKSRQERQQLYDMTEQLCKQLQKLKNNRDSQLIQIKQLQDELQRMGQYAEQLKEETMRLREKNQKNEKNLQIEENIKLLNENQMLRDKSKQLERQLKQAMKAIQEFKNDALGAREEIIVKEQEINLYKQKFGQLGSLTDVLRGAFGNNGRTSLEVENQNKNRLIKDNSAVENKNLIATIPSLTSSTSNQNFHSIYSQLLQNSIQDRKQLQHSLSQIISQKPQNSAFSSVLSLNSLKQVTLRKMQTNINKMFIEFLRNRTQIKHIKQLQKIKGEISRQMEELLTSA